MKIIVASDIHGSNYYTKKLLKIIESEKPDQIILLGDIYYHGPRNKFPKGYAPMKVAENLNNLSNKLRCVKGNCDAEVDQMISSFSLEDSIEMTIAGKKFLFIHGQNLDFENLPTNYDYIFGGHTHVSSIKTFKAVTYVNPGSVSLPKENTAHSYALINDSEISIIDLKGEIIKKHSYN